MIRQAWRHLRAVDKDGFAQAMKLFIDLFDWHYGIARRLSGGGMIVARATLPWNSGAMRLTVGLPTGEVWLGDRQLPHQRLAAQPRTALAR